MMFDLPPDPPKFWLPEKPAIIRSASAIDFPKPAIIRLRGDVDLPAIIQSLLPGMVHCGASGAAAPVGQAEWATAGTYEWEVPEGVHSLSIVAVGAGGGGLYHTSGPSGGNGGDLRFIRVLSVSPGDLIEIIVGAAGISWTTSEWTSGGFSRVSVNGVPVLEAAGGGRGITTNGTAPNQNGTSTAKGGNIGGGDGGKSTAPSSETGSAGGGGAGGYAGDGGDGGVYNGANDSGDNGAGGGAGGGRASSIYGGGGGGVDIYGQGSNGSGANPTGDTTAGGGSGGESVNNGASDGSRGGQFGGGAGGADTTTTTTARPAGGGAVRAIWGPGRQYPSTNTADM